MTRMDTRAVHAARHDLRHAGVHVPSIDLSTTNPLTDVLGGGDSYEALATGGDFPPGGSAVYQRLWNPTVARFEDAIAELEGTAGAVAFASGMAGLTACLLGAQEDGCRHVVAVRPLYGGSDHLLSNGLLGTEVTWAEAGQIGAAVRADTCLVVVETPANPSLELVDIAAVVAQSGTVPVLVDNTFATPILQQPARHGAALVLHSATKYIGGHGDVMGGVVAADEQWVPRLRRVRAITGGILHPLGAYLLHRGLQTLPLRVRAAQATATELARRLASHPGVRGVRHPSLPGQDPLGLLGSQLAGPGSILALDLGSFDFARAVIESTLLVAHAVSLGGTESLIQHPASLTHRPVAADARPDPGLVRLAVGLEDVEDLYEDLCAALEVALSSPSERRPKA